MFVLVGSNCGGERAASMDTLIGSAKLNCLDPELYLLKCTLGNGMNEQPKMPTPDTPQILLERHRKTLRLPTIGRELQSGQTVRPPSKSIIVTRTAPYRGELTIADVAWWQAICINLADKTVLPFILAIDLTT